MDDEVNGLNMRSGSNAMSVARLNVGATHALSREVEPPSRGGGLELAETISKVRSSMAHLATAVISRVREKLPERAYTVSTGVMTTSDNRLWVCAVIERQQ